MINEVYSLPLTKASDNKTQLDIITNYVIQKEKQYYILFFREGFYKSIYTAQCSYKTFEAVVSDPRTLDIFYTNRDIIKSIDAIGLIKNNTYITLRVGQKIILDKHTFYPNLNEDLRGAADIYKITYTYDEFFDDITNSATCRQFIEKPLRIVFLGTKILLADEKEVNFCLVDLDIIMNHLSIVNDIQVSKEKLIW